MKKFLDRQYKGMIQREEKNLHAFNYGKSKGLQKSLKEVVKPNFAYNENGLKSKTAKGGGAKKGMKRNQTHLGWKVSLRDASQGSNTSRSR